MSWDIFISKTPIDELEEALFDTLGKKEEVIDRIIEILPSANFKNQDWGNYRDEECSIEIALGDSEKIDHLMLYIRGKEKNRPIVIIKEICKEFESYAMDCSSGEQMNFDETDKSSFKAWQDYRNSILKSQ